MSTAHASQPAAPAPKSKTPSRIATITASINRGPVLLDTLRGLKRQTVMPDESIVAVVKESDCPVDPEELPWVKRVLSAPGVCHQQNAAIDALGPDIDFVLIMDDDMELHATYLERMRQYFLDHPDVVAINGTLLKNGDVSREDAVRLVVEHQANPRDEHWEPSGDWGGLYGCNMSFRRTVLDKERFDEGLPLYAELSEVDYGVRVRQHGRVGNYFALKAVHLQYSGGRMKGQKQGFSQIINAVYLARKGRFNFWRILFKFVLRYPLVNLFFLLKGDKKVDRWGRLKGNAYAYWCLLRGKPDPNLIHNL